MGDKLETILTIIVIAAVVLSKLLGKKSHDDGEMPSELSDDNTPPQYTPLPESLREKGVEVLPPTSSERAAFELQKTRSARQQHFGRDSARTAAASVRTTPIERTPHQATLRQAPLMGTSRRSARETTFERHLRENSDRWQSFEDMFVPAPEPCESVASISVPPASMAPPTPILPLSSLPDTLILEEAGCVSSLNCADIRNELSDARYLRHMFLIKELLSPPLSMRRDDVFSTFPYER